MRFLFLLLLPFLFASCAYEGVIVKKNSRPHPFYESLGVEEMSSIELRDSSGVVHRQMVTPDVYARYEDGQYFNDLQPPPAEPDKDLEPTLVPMRPVKPIAHGHGRGNGSGLAVNTHRPASRTAASTGTRKATVATHSSLVARAAIAARHAAPQPAAQPIRVSQARISNPAIARKPTVETPSSPSTTKPVANASIAHFSAEISPRGVKPVATSTSAQTSAPHRSPAVQHNAKSGAHRKSAAKPAKAKSMLKPPSVETRSESDRVPNGDGSSR